jgi:hypothetical protein
MTDAQGLVDQLAKVKKGECSMQEAIKEYEAEVVDRGTKAVNQSIKDAEDALNLPQIGQSHIATKGLKGEHQE